MNTNVGIGLWLVKFKWRFAGEADTYIQYAVINAEDKQICKVIAERKISPGDDYEIVGKLQYSGDGCYFLPDFVEIKESD